MVFGLFEPTAIFCFHVALVQLVAAVIWTLQIYALSLFLLRLGISAMLRLDGAFDVLSQRCFGHLVLTAHWTSRLGGALDVSDMVWTSSKGPKKSYKYDLANSLVSLIALSHDHQNHSKCSKWGHVHYTVLIEL